MLVQIKVCETQKVKLRVPVGTKARRTWMMMDSFSGSVTMPYMIPESWKYWSGGLVRELVPV